MAGCSISLEKSLCTSYDKLHIVFAEGQAGSEVNRLLWLPAPSTHRRDHDMTLSVG